MMTKKVISFWGKNTVNPCSENPGYAYEAEGECYSVSIIFWCLSSDSRGMSTRGNVLHPMTWVTLVMEAESRSSEAQEYARYSAHNGRPSSWWRWWRWLKRSSAAAWLSIATSHARLQRVSVPMRSGPPGLSWQYKARVGNVKAKKVK